MTHYIFFQCTQEIRKKIEELGFDDCKVLVTQVDSQVSAGNGILVQVLGEMCNRDAPLQKFSQTFFLAPQPNGYYVLNDIFRFLKEEVDIDYYTCEEQEQKPAKKAATNEAASTTNEASSELAELDSTAATTASTPVVEPVAPAETNAAAAAATESAKEVEKKETPAATKDAETKPKSTEAAKPKAAKPEAAKTWANLAAGNDTNKWKSTATTDNKAQPSADAAAAAKNTAQKTPQSQQTAPSHALTKDKEKEQAPRKGMQRKTEREICKTADSINAFDVNAAEEATEVFLKNVKGVTVEQIKEVFTAEIGEVKSVTLSSFKPTGFLEFASPEHCQKALAQHKVKVGETIVLVEERRPKFNRQQPNGAGGAFERRYQGGHHRRGGGAPRGGGSRSRGGAAQKSG